MILKILLLIMLFATPSYAQEYALNSAIIGLAGGASGVTCTTANDTELWVKTGSNNAGTHYVYCAQKVLLAATTSLTEYFFTMCDNGTDAGTVEVSLYTHNVGSNQPNTQVSGTAKSINASVLQNCTAYGSAQFTLDPVKTGVASGSYWLVTREVGSTLIVPYDTGDTGGRICGSDDGSTWTCYDDLKHMNAVWGCQ